MDRPERVAEGAGQSITADRLREVLYESGLSQRAFAAAIGASLPALQNWLKGTESPRADRLTAIALSFGVSSDWLLGLHGTRRGRRAGGKSTQRVAYELILRAVVRLDRRLTPQLVATVLGDEKDVWDYTLRVLGARALIPLGGESLQRWSASYESLAGSLLAHVIAAVEARGAIPSPWRERAPRLSPADVDELLSEIPRVKSSLKRGRRGAQGARRAK